MHAETKHYLTLIEDLRGQVRDLLVELPVEALNWRPLAGVGDHATNSLAVMAAHVIGAEQLWMDGKSKPSPRWYRRLPTQE